MDGTGWKREAGPQMAENLEPSVLVATVDVSAAALIASRIPRGSRVRIAVLIERTAASIAAELVASGEVDFLIADRSACAAILGEMPQSPGSVAVLPVMEPFGEECLAALAALGVRVPLSFTERAATVLRAACDAIPLFAAPARRALQPITYPVVGGRLAF